MMQLSLQTRPKVEILPPATSLRKGESSDRSWMTRISTDIVHAGPTVYVGGPMCGTQVDS
jgi:hypothetical protein